MSSSPLSSRAGRRPRVFLSDTGAYIKKGKGSFHKPVSWASSCMKKVREHDLSGVSRWPELCRRYAVTPDEAARTACEEAEVGNGVRFGQARRGNRLSHQKQSLNDGVMHTSSEP